MSPDTTFQDQQCQILIRNLLKLNLCNTQQASLLWQGWKLKQKQISVGPADFLIQQGVPAEHIQKAMGLSPGSFTNSSFTNQISQPEEIRQINNKLAFRLKQEGRIDVQTLGQLLNRCNREGVNLGQTLVRNRHLAINDLVHLLKEIATKKPGSVTNTGTRYHDTQSREQSKEITSDNKPAILTAGRFGNYKILGEIARGGMGVVYRAQQIHMQRIVALKILLSGANADPSQVKRFFRETEVTASLDHPNIVPIYEVGEEKGYHYFVMKYIEGTTFENIISTPDKLEYKLKMLIKICNALDYAHTRSILHRDIKPSNILIDQDEEPYITDFGLAKFTERKSSLTQTGTAIGTPFYMPPEQVKGEKALIDQRSDIYSMGIILYQVLTGQLPFQANGLTELYRKICEEEPVAPRDLIPETAADLNAVCLKALAKERDSRYHCAAEMGKDLQDYINGRKVSARKINVKSKMLRWQRQNRSKIVTAFAVVPPIVLILVSLFFFVQSRKQERIKQAEIRSKIKQQCIQAQSLLHRRDYQQALAILTKILQNNQADFEVHLLLGQVYQKLENFSQAEHQFLKAEKLNPDQPVLAYHKANLYLLTQRYKQALNLISKGISQQPQSSPYYRLRASIYRNLGQTGPAAQDVMTARQLEKEKLESFLHRVAGYVKQKETGQALAALDEILSQYPYFEKAYLTRAQIYYDRKELNRALEDISRAIELNPAMEYYTLKGDWLVAGGYIPAAIKNFQKALEQNQNKQQQFIFLQKLAELYIQKEQYQKSYDTYQKLIQEDRQSHSIYLGLAQAAYHLKKYTIVLKNIENALALEEIPAQDKAKALFYRGSVYFYQQKISAAYQDLQTALRLGAEQKGQLYYLLGKICLQKNKIKSAGLCLTRASKLLPESVEVLELLAEYYTKIKKYHKAINIYSHCIKRRPWIVAYYEKRGTCYSDLKQFERSRPDYYKCLEMQPSNASPLIKIINDSFAGFILKGMGDVHALIIQFTHNFYGSSEPDLFISDQKEISDLYLKQPTLKTNHPEIKTAWDLKKVQFLVKALMESDSPAVIDMAQTGLMTMYRHRELQDYLEKIIQDKHHWPHVIRRLKKSLKAIKSKYIEEEKELWRSLLLRFYAAGDDEALREIYHQRQESVPGLEKLLYSKENIHIRYFAARALQELSTWEAHVVLMKGLNSDQPDVQILCARVLSDKGFELPYQGALKKVAEVEEALVRALAVELVPTEPKNALKKYLGDKDVRVRLYAAKRLWRQMEPAAEKILVQNFKHQDPQIRFYALATFWDFENFDPQIKDKNLKVFKQKLKVFKEKVKVFKEKYTQKHLKKLVEAADDPNPDVRRVALLGFEKLEDKGVTKYLSKCFQDQDDRVRFQAIISMARRGNLDLIIKVINDPNEPIIFKMAGCLGVYSGDVRAASHHVLSLLTSLDRNDPRIKILALYLFAKHGRDFGLSYLVHKYWDSKDINDQIGLILGLFGRATPDMQPKIETFLEHPNEGIRAIATATLVCLLNQHKIKNREAKLKTLLNSASPMIRKGAAFGYVWPFYERYYYGKLDKKSLKKASWKIEERYNEFIEVTVRAIQKSKNPQLKNTPFVDYYKEAIRMEPEKAHYYFEKGIIHYLQRDFEASISSIKKAMELDPDFYLYKFWLAKVYTANNRYDDALIYLKQVLHQRPWNLHALQAQKEIFQLRGDSKGVQTAARRIHLIDPIHH